jgi:hypothetical protein
VSRYLVVSDEHGGGVESPAEAGAAVPLKIFINYRREEASFPAHRLYEDLAECFGEDQVFIDVDTIEPGLPFDEVIEREVSSCDVLLAMIGPNWLELADHTGRRRLDKPDDYVRLELEAALGRGTRVIPALLREAVPLSSDQLPESLQRLARLQALPLSDDRRWREDVERLIRLLRKLPEAKVEAAAQAAGQQRLERERVAREAAEEAAREQAEHERLELERQQLAETVTREKPSPIPETVVRPQPTPPAEEKPAARAPLPTTVSGPVVSAKSSETVLSEQPVVPAKSPETVRSGRRSAGERREGGLSKRTLLLAAALLSVALLVAGGAYALLGGSKGNTTAADVTPPPARPQAAPPPPAQPRCRVPEVRGLKRFAAKRKLARGDCALGRVDYRYSSRVASGRIAAQTPRPGSRLKEERRVRVVLSKGPRPEPPPVQPQPPSVQPQPQAPQPQPPPTPRCPGGRCPIAPPPPPQCPGGRCPG